MVTKKCNRAKTSEVLVNKVITPKSVTEFVTVILHGYKAKLLGPNSFAAYCNHVTVNYIGLWGSIKIGNY